MIRLSEDCPRIESRGRRYLTGVCILVVDHQKFLVVGCSTDHQNAKSTTKSALSRTPTTKTASLRVNSFDVYFSLKERPEKDGIISKSLELVLNIYEYLLYEGYP